MLIELIKDLVSIDSSTKTGANRAVEFCADWLSKNDLKAKVLNNNGYKMLVCEIGSGNKTIIFNGHVDVVSGRPDQFFPNEADGKLYGRGTADMKAGVAAMMVALTELKKLPIGVKVQLQIVADEEIGGLNCTGYLVKNGFTGDFVICSEPTQLGIGLQAKGLMHFDIDIDGKPAHSSRPWEGVNAIEKAYGVYLNILNLPFAKETSDFYDCPSINLAKINAGEVYNKVPDKCIVSFDIRYLPKQDRNEIIRQIESITDGNILVRFSTVPVKTKPDDPYISLLKPVIQKYTGYEPLVFGQHGTADTVYFSALGIPVIEFGPCGFGWHGNEEYIVTESVEIYKDMLIDYIREFVPPPLH
ncbi:M20 family metallopeptidase [Peribacillus sp. SCS-155]|uniref:M20 family metallopeptidase n=1 Tax=Peribacillus sedimenti TaxID=3115297 RepID=UPI00390687AA